jgi:hypothetical protein
MKNVETGTVNVYVTISFRVYTNAKMISGYDMACGQREHFDRPCSIARRKQGDAFFSTRGHGIVGVRNCSGDVFEKNSPVAASTIDWTTDVDLANTSSLQFLTPTIPWPRVLKNASPCFLRAIEQGLSKRSLSTQAIS